MRRIYPCEHRTSAFCTQNIYEMPVTDPLKREDCLTENAKQADLRMNEMAGRTAVFESLDVFRTLQERSTAKEKKEE